MLIKQDFAQLEPKSPAKRSLKIVRNTKPDPKESSNSLEPNRDKKLLQETIAKIDGAYAPSTIRAYRADFNDFICFCHDRNANALPAQPDLIAQYITELTESGRSSASIRRALCGLSAIHRLNRFDDPTKDPDVNLEMRRMHRKLGRASRQAIGINADILEKMLLATDNSIRGVRDRALLLVAYDTLCRRSELVSLEIKDVKSTIKNGLETSSIFLRKSKTDQELIGVALYLSQRAHFALIDWIKILPRDQKMLFCGINRDLKINHKIAAGQINRIYKQIAQNAGIEKFLIERISGHSMRVGAAQDLLHSGISLPIIMQRGRWSKTDTMMRYVENYNPIHR